MEHLEVLKKLRELIQIGVPIEKICHTLEVLQAIGFLTLNEYAELYQEIVDNI